MAYSEHLVDRVRQRLINKGSIVEKKMMGGLIFMVNNKMCVGVDTDKETNEDRLMVRVGKLNYQALLQKTGSKKMDFTGKVMRRFLFIEPDGFDAETDMDFWIEKALEFNKLILSK